MMHTINTTLNNFNLYQKLKYVHPTKIPPREYMYAIISIHPSFPVENKTIKTYGKVRTRD